MVESLSHVWLFATPWIGACRLLCPWRFPGKKTRVDYHFLLQGIFLTQGLNPCLLLGRWILYQATWEAIIYYTSTALKLTTEYFYRLKFNSESIHWERENNGQGEGERMNGITGSKWQRNVFKSIVYSDHCCHCYLYFQLYSLWPKSIAFTVYPKLSHLLSFLIDLKNRV